jgi:serine protease Do
VGARGACGVTAARRARVSAALRGALLGLLLVGTSEAAAPPTAAPRPNPGAAAPTPSAVSRMRAAVVGIEALVPPDRPSAATLGEERSGAATIIEPDGLAVTVGYLVLEAARIDVTLEDGRRVPARVVGHDFESGLALIQLDPAGRPYPAVPLGRSASLAVGQPVAIVGIGPGGAASGAMGHVTGVGPFVAYWEYLLEHAIFVAPHHPGFGGAALVDPDGTLVGVVSLRLAAGHLAIPIDLLAPVRDAMVRTGRPARGPRPWLGIRAIAVGGGIGIAGVSPAGPAAVAGLRPGDVIVRVNGELVTEVEAFYRRLWALPVDQPLQLSVSREGVLETISVRPRDRYATFGPPSP